MSDKDNYTHAIIAFRRPREAVIPEIDSDVKLEKDTSHNLQKKNTRTLIIIVTISISTTKLCHLEKNRRIKLSKCV